MKKKVSSPSRVYSVDDVLFVCMTFGVLYNKALDKKDKGVARKVKRRLSSFVMRHVSLCRLAADRYKTMTEDARSEFLHSYKPAEDLIKETQFV